MMTLALLLVALTTHDSMQSNEVVVRHGSDAVVRYRARIEEDFLIITAIHEKGWHTYAMDNELRALTALQGKPSLGIEQGIDIQVGEGLELSGPWLQTKPRDLSKPELRWFSYGFDQTALFARRIKEVTSDQVILRIRGQACSGETCCQVDVTLKLDAANDPNDTPTQANALQVKARLKDLVPVDTGDHRSTNSDRKSLSKPAVIDLSRNGVINARRLGRFDLALYRSGDALSCLRRASPSNVSPFANHRFTLKTETTLC